MSLFQQFTGSTGRLSIFLGRHLLGLLGLLGRVLLKTLGLLTRSVRFPAADVVRQLDRMGFGSMGVIILAASTVGISLVFLSLDQLKSLGGLSLLAFFFSKAMLREIGPVIAGIVMAVRVGSQVTVQIGSVPVEERTLPLAGGRETDLVKLLLPAFLAVLLVGPALYLMGSFFGFLAGVVSQTRGSGENFMLFTRMILENFSVQDLEFGLYKSLLFGVVVVIVAGYMGLITLPRQADLQKATVNSIVFSSVFVLIINTFFALSYNASTLIYQLQGL